MKVFRLSKMLLDLVLFCCFLCIFLIRERFVLPKFVFHHEFGLYCFCCALSRSCRYHSKFRRFKPICFLVLFVLVVEMHHSVLSLFFFAEVGSLQGGLGRSLFFFKTLWKISIAYSVDWNPSTQTVIHSASKAALTIEVKRLEQY